VALGVDPSARFGAGSRRAGQRRLIFKPNIGPRWPLEDVPTRVSDPAMVPLELPLGAIRMTMPLRHRH